MEKQDVYNLALQKATDIAPGYGIDPAQLAGYLTAIAKKESGWDPAAKNKSSSARGLYQILICTQREVEKKRAKVDFPSASYPCSHYRDAPVGSADDDQMYQADYATFIAAHELAYQWRRYKSWEKAVHAYNQGSFKKSSLAGNNYANDVAGIFNDINNPELAYNDATVRSEFY